MKSKKSREEFVKAVYTLSQSQNGCVRSWQLANQLGVSRTLVSLTVKALTQEGYLYFDSQKAVCLTSEGYQLGLYGNGTQSNPSGSVLFLGVAKETAEKDAGKLAHILGEECMAALWAFVQECRDVREEGRNLCNEPF